MIKQSHSKRFQKAIDARFHQEGDLAKTSLLAKAGDAKGNLYITGKPGFIHARGADGNYYQVYTELKGLEYDQPIRIGRLKDDDKIIRVLSVWSAYDTPIQGKLELHGSDHSLGGRDVTPVWLGQFMWWNAQPFTELLVRVYRPIRRVYGTTYLPPMIEDVDLSIYTPPGGGAFYLLIEVLSSGELNVIQGIEVEDKNQLTLDDLPQGTPGAFPIAGYARYEGQDSWTLTNEWSDYIDLRFSDYGSSSSDPDYGGGSLPTFDPARVAYTDPTTGDLKTSDELIFNETDDTLTTGDPDGSGDGDGSYLHGFGGDKTHSGVLSTFHNLVTYAGDNARASLVKLISSLGTKASPLAVTVGTLLGRLRFAGYDGDTRVVDSATSADIKAIATEDFDSSGHGTKVVISTTPNNSTTMQDVMEIGEDGQITLNEYGSGTHTGTATKFLAVDENGNVIEEDGGSGGSSDGWIEISATLTPRSQVYTNDPSSGSNITLNMTDTSDFEVDMLVNVSSSAGNEDAFITSIVPNTSITVDVLTLNHTTTNPLVKISPAIYVSKEFTNDPSSGSNITLNMTDTTSYNIGNKVRVQSTAGWEFAVIVSIVTNTSITVNALALNHTTINRSVTVMSNYNYIINTSADSTGEINVGDRIKVTDTTDKYFIVHKITTTTMILFGGTKFSIVSTSALSSPKYSHAKVPHGFDSNPVLWTIDATFSSDFTISSPTANNYYGGTLLTPTGPIIIFPVGVWRTRMHVQFQVLITLGSAANVSVRIGLSIANNAIPADLNWLNLFLFTLPTITGGIVRTTVTNINDISITSTTKYYVVVASGNNATSETIMGATVPACLKLTSAYL